MLKTMLVWRYNVRKRYSKGLIQNWLELNKSWFGFNVKQSYIVQDSLLVLSQTKHCNYCACEQSGSADHKTGTRVAQISFTATHMTLVSVCAVAVEDVFLHVCALVHSSTPLTICLVNQIGILVCHFCHNFHATLFAWGAPFCFGLLTALCHWMAFVTLSRIVLWKKITVHALP